MPRQGQGDPSGSYTVVKYSFFFSHHHFIEHMVLINLIKYIATVHSDYH